MAEWKQARWLEELAAIDRAIRAGEQNSADRRLRTCIRNGVPREHLAAIAMLSRRAGQGMLGVRLLNPLVRLTENRLDVATDKEKAEYAACLTYVGAAEEASEILATLDATALPEVLLYRTLALFPQWDYASAIPLLREYLARVSNEYQRLVARINLCDALIYEGAAEEALPILEPVARAAQAEGHALVFARALQLLARAHLERRDWLAAEMALQTARQHLPDDGLQRFFVDKWLAIRLYFVSGARDSGLLDQVRRDALKIAHWETLRDCDRYQALATKDPQTLRYVYFGTPFASFRHRLVTDAKIETPTGTFDWRLAVPGASPRVLDPANAEGLKPGQLLYRLLTCLASDFYRPFRGPYLYSRLYPGQYFNPESSPLQVRSAIKRLREWFERAGWPIEIEEVDGGYRLRASAPCALRTSLAAEADSMPLLLSRLHERLPTEPFTARQAAEILGANLRSAQRVLQEGIDAGTLERIGSGPATKYVFPSVTGGSVPTRRSGTR
jgi:tetratricopeptide (TPR) repeat protein